MDIETALNLIVERRGSLRVETLSDGTLVMTTAVPDGAYLRSVTVAEPPYPAETRSLTARVADAVYDLAEQIDPPTDPAGYRHLDRPATVTFQSVPLPTPQPHVAAPLGISIVELNLSVRATNCLEGAGILTVGQLVERSAADLLLLPRFGEATLAEVVDALREIGCRLRSE